MRLVVSLVSYSLTILIWIALFLRADYTAISVAEIISATCLFVFAIWISCSIFISKYDTKKYGFERSYVRSSIIWADELFPFIGFTIQFLVSLTYSGVLYYFAPYISPKVIEFFPRGFFVIAIFEILLFGILLALQIGNRRANVVTTANEERILDSRFEHDSLVNLAKMLESRTNGEVKEAATRLVSLARSMPLKTGFNNYRDSSDLKRSLINLVSQNSQVSLSQLLEIEQSMKLMR